VEKIHHLRRSSFFERLGVQEAHVVARPAEAVRYADGATIFARGDFADAVFCVLEGRVDVHGPSGSIGRHAGDVFGDAGLRGEYLRGGDAISRGARVLVVPNAPLLVAARNHPRIAAVVFRNALEAQPA
jgi:CRP-like cAMP-binding protein